MYVCMYMLFCSYWGINVTFILTVGEENIYTYILIHTSAICVKFSSFGNTGAKIPDFMHLYYRGNDNVNSNLLFG